MHVKLKSYPRNTIASTMRIRPLFSFFLISYVTTWTLWSPVILNGLSVTDPDTNSPALSTWPGAAVGVTGTAFLMTAVTQGRAGLRALLKGLFDRRIRIRWFAASMLVVPLGEIAVTAALGSPEILNVLTPAAVSLYPLSYVSHLYFGPLLEEAGWRGFALPILQNRLGPFWGTTVLGLLWSGWHFFLYAPSYFECGIKCGSFNLSLFIATVVIMSFTFTWLFNRTGGNLLITILLHGTVDGTATYMHNLADRRFISYGVAKAATSSSLLITFTLLSVVLLWRTRGRLSYDHLLRVSA